MLRRIVWGFLLLYVVLRLDGIARWQGWVESPPEWTSYFVVFCALLLLLDEWGRHE